MSAGEASNTRNMAGTLAREWNVKADQIRYSEWGNFYGPLERFPAALFDKNGYVFFQTAAELDDWVDKNLGVYRTKKINIKAGISSLPGYILGHPHSISGAKVANPGRVETLVDRIVRDTAAAADVKRRHNDCCQICGLTLRFSNGKAYSEGHHLQPLGTPHSGPDVKDNIICVCPNCHAELDCGGAVVNIDTLRRALGHDVGGTYIEYHNARIFNGGAPTLLDKGTLTRTATSYTDDDIEQRIDYGDMRIC